MFYIGEILKTRGNSGDLIISTSPEFKFNTAKVQSLELKSKKYDKILEVERIQELGNSLQIKFKGIDSINDAYRLIGYSVYISDPNLIEKFKKKTLVGYRVFDLTDREWGFVIDDSESQFSRTLTVDVDGDEVYVPYTENIIKAVDEDIKQIVIDPPDGLLDLNR